MQIQASAEKSLATAEHLEMCDTGGSLLPSTGVSYEQAEVDRIVRKVDIRLCVVLAIMYTICQIDRTNLANAVVAGMGKDIDLSGTHYPLMTVVARKIGPRVFLSAITIAWGIIMIGFGLVNTWQPYIGLRAALGFLEAGFFPTCIFLISTWYTRHETAKRIAIFYLLGSALSGFGGIIAYGLQQMHGLVGMAGWRWIFIIEGILTVVIGLIGWLFIVGFPEDAQQTRWFLTDGEIDIMMDRVEKDRGDSHVTPFILKRYLSHALEWKSWMFALNFCMTTVVNYSAVYFLPIILNEGLGFSQAAAQSLSAPCYIFGSILGFAESWLSDKYKARGIVIVINAILQIVGISVLGFAKQSPVRYFGAFMLVGSGSANIPASLTYQSNNIVGQWRRAFGSALVIGAGGVGGVVGSLVFRNQDKPNYRPGLYTCFIAASIIVISVLITSIAMRQANKRQKRGGITIMHTPTFRYTL